MLGVQLSCVVPVLLKAHSSFVDRHHRRDSRDTIVAGTTVCVLVMFHTEVESKLISSSSETVYIATHGVAMVDTPWSKQCKLIDPTLIMSKEV